MVSAKGDLGRRWGRSGRRGSCSFASAGVCQLGKTVALSNAPQSDQRWCRAEQPEGCASQCQSSTNPLTEQIETGREVVPMERKCRGRPSP